jgi:hypothetical protein
MLFDRGVIDPVSLLSDWGRMVENVTLEYEVFLPPEITLRVSIEDPLRLYFAV